MKKLLSIMLAAILIIGCFTTVSFGTGGTKKMTAYNVIKKGNVVYCATGRGVYKVFLKSGKVKALFKMDEEEAYDCGPIKAMKLYKNYVFFLHGGPMTDSLYRIKISGGKTKILSKGIVGGYAISKNKIYFEEYNFDNYTKSKKVMSLNGKNKKKSSYSVKMTNKKANKKGYYIESVDEGMVDDEYWGEAEEYTDYLITPSGKRIKLCIYYSMS